MGGRVSARNRSDLGRKREEGKEGGREGGAKGEDAPRGIGGGGLGDLVGGAVGGDDPGVALAREIEKGGRGRGRGRVDEMKRMKGGREGWRAGGREGCTGHCC